MKWLFSHCLTIIIATAMVLVIPLLWHPPANRTASADEAPIQLSVSDPLPASFAVMRESDTEVCRRTITEPTWIPDLSISEPPEITIGFGDSSITIITKGGKLDIIGDPNHYTEAAKLFWTVAAPDAIYSIFAANDGAIRKLCESGRVCAVMGHQWMYETPWFLYDPNTITLVASPDGYQMRTCSICGKCQSRSLTEWGGE